jgi:hypothetical protein
MFGVARDELLGVFRDYDVVLYYGHFSLASRPLDSYFETRPQYPAGRVSVDNEHHPWCGEEFVFVAVRHTWGEDRVFFFADDGTQKSLPGGLD